jgi:3-oxoacyl-[acyl-carrier protein] reductase
MDLQLTGKVVAITGGSRGIGLATALRLAEEGASLAICGRGTHDLARAHALIEGEGTRCLAYSCDLTEAGEASAFVATAAETFGRIDAIVCAAGGGAPPSRSERDDWEAIFRLNLFHAVEAARAASSLMLRGGAVLFVSLVPGGKPQPAPWPCGAARAALEHAAMSLARELAPRGVRVNALVTRSALFACAVRPAEDHQGTVDGEPASECHAAEGEIADLATFLVSPRAGWVSGTTVQVAGGLGKSGLVSGPGAP